MIVGKCFGTVRAVVILAFRGDELFGILNFIPGTRFLHMKTFFPEFHTADRASDRTECARRDWSKRLSPARYFKVSCDISEHRENDVYLLRIISRTARIRGALQS